MLGAGVSFVAAFTSFFGAVNGFALEQGGEKNRQQGSSEKQGYGRFNIGEVRRAGEEFGDNCIHIGSFGCAR